MKQGVPVSTPPEPPFTKERAYMELVDAVQAINRVVQSGVLPTDLRIRLVSSYLAVQGVAREIMTIPPPDIEEF